jgi:hypothetical protein
MTTSHLNLTITLAETEGMPYIVARCSPKGWNGFHAPRLSPETLADYFAASAAADPNGSWDMYSVTTDTVDGERVMRFHNCEVASCDPVDGHDDEQDDIVPLDDDGTFFLDGWCWVSPRDDDGAVIAPATEAPRAGTVIR